MFEYGVTLIVFFFQVRQLMQNKDEWTLKHGSEKFRQTEWLWMLSLATKTLGGIQVVYYLKYKTLINSSRHTFVYLNC